MDIKRNKNIKNRLLNAKIFNLMLCGQSELCYNYYVKSALNRAPSWSASKASSDTCTQHATVHPRSHCCTAITRDPSACGPPYSEATSLLMSPHLP